MTVAGVERPQALAKGLRSVCTSCAQAIRDDARQVETALAFLWRCLVCRSDIAQLRADARTCGDGYRNVLSRLLRSRRRPVC